MLNGLLDLSVWQIVIATLAMTHVTIAAITIYLHRHQAHRALDMNPVLAHFFRFWLWLSTGMVTREWVAVHRKHHAKCETQEDPHSPFIRGIKTVFWRGAELYKSEARTVETVKKYSRGCPDDWLENVLFSKGRNLGIGTMLVIDIALFGIAGITVWAVQMLWTPVLAAGVINGLGHWWGYRSFQSDDTSTNLIPWGILIGGEELHNNHHAYASSAKLSVKWYEFDIGWMYIKIFEFLGLAKVRNVHPLSIQIPEKVALDSNTVRDVINNRFDVMSHYAKKVTRIVYEDELHNADVKIRQLLANSRKLILTDQQWLSEESKKKLQNMLNASNQLDTVYEFKMKLQSIWSQRNKGQEKLLPALQEWCKQAEESGIRSLQEFSTYLRGYALV